MIFTETKIPGAFVIELERRHDERGFFARQWCADEFTRPALDLGVAQINTARSVAARGQPTYLSMSPNSMTSLAACTTFDIREGRGRQGPRHRSVAGGPDPDR